MNHTRVRTARACDMCGKTYFPRTDQLNPMFCSMLCKNRAPRKAVESLTYSQLHVRVRKEHGSAVLYPCSSGCGRVAQNWASLDDYLKMDDYVPLCISCHKRFDLWRLGKRKDFR